MTQNLLTELAKAKAVFQLRAILSVMGLPVDKVIKDCCETIAKAKGNEA